MAFFAVTIETINESKPHPNADRLDITTLNGLGFQFVTGKGQYKTGDKVLYFPVDSILPPELQKSLGVEGKLSGPNKNQIRTIKLRGEYSQGMVGPLSLIDNMELGSDITSFFGVTKYEPPVVLVNGANLLPLPCGLSHYDIEGCDRFIDVVNELMDQKVYITEKLEGSNASVTYNPVEDKVYVNQRNYTIQNLDGIEHTWWKVAREQGIIDFAKKLSLGYGNRTVTVYGECLGNGIQKNIYQLKGQEFHVFDIKVENDWIPAEMFIALCDGNSVKRVPSLDIRRTLREILNGRTIDEYATGESKLYKHLREGIVIKPLEEQYSPILKGRLFLKHRSCEYRVKTGN